MTTLAIHAGSAAMEQRPSSAEVSIAKNSHPNPIENPSGWLNVGHILCHRQMLRMWICA